VKQASRKSKIVHPVSDKVVKNIREVLVFASLIFALYLLISLFSFNADDSAWSSSVSNTVIQNHAGAVGAYIADFLLSVFGYFGYLIPFLFLMSGWRLYQTRLNQKTFDHFIFSIHLIGVLLLFVGGCGILWMHFNANTWLPSEIRGAGGIIGYTVGPVLLKLTGLDGSTLIMLALFMIGLTLYTGLSWLLAVDSVGKFALNAITKFRNNLSSLNDFIEGRRARKDRGTVFKIEQDIVEQRDPVKIEPIISDLKPSIRSIMEKQENLFEPAIETALPPLNLLDKPVASIGQYSKETLEAMSRQVELKLKDFGVDVKVVAVHPGPVITRFELDPAPGIKGNQIINLSKDLARSLAVVSVRIVDVIPGKPYIGLEIPNENRELVTLGEILNTNQYESISSPLALALGKNISGIPVVTDLDKMPHLLVAGTTGSGKSVALNAMILSLLYKSTASEVRMIMIDPKMLELSVYEGIPNLLSPVVTDMKEAANALRWCVAEMERRYKLMAKLGVRNISGYNRKVTEAIDKGQPISDPFYIPLTDEEEIPYLEKLPFIVVVIDELADMMMTTGKKVEELIARLAQKARAAGIHLILATQRPSVDVITGLIKANIPCRIAFQVSSKVDSRTILDQMGAEQLLGHGDMLFLPAGTSNPERVHGAFVSDEEVHKVVGNLKSLGRPEYNEDILRGPNEGGAEAIPGLDTPTEEMDSLYDEAVRIVIETRKPSISYIQRRLKVGYNRAARIVEEMEKSGLVGPLESNGSREILIPPTNE
jgi:S-DNA-T family DNA segregation ATPase FtsK/SpoIIIE